MSTYGGGLQFVASNDGHQIQTIRLDNSAPFGLLYNDLKPLLRDRSGWLWIGTWGMGLQRLNIENRAISTLKYSANRSTGLSYPDVSSILELQDGRLLVGTSGNGIDIIDRQRGLIGGYRQVGGNRTSRNEGRDREESYSLPDRVIPALAQTNDGAYGPAPKSRVWCDSGQQ